ncbi:unnamed protein product [Prunus armeniaca]
MVRHFPAQLSDYISFDSKHTVSPRAPVWYRPKALRCLSLGRCAICLEFRCGTLDISCGTATCERRRGCPNAAIGGFGTEGGCRRHPWPWFSPRVRYSLAVHLRINRSPPSPLVRVLGRGFEVVFSMKGGPTRLTLAKSEGRVQRTGEWTSERLDFRAPRAVSPP